MWQKGGIVVSNDSVLYIESVGISDDGTYDCTASNTFGEDMMSFKLDVLGNNISALKLSGFCFILWD